MTGTANDVEVGHATTATVAEVAAALRQGHSPCGHNNWNSLRVNRRAVTLQCRDCLATWKLNRPVVTFCQDFYENGCFCALGVDCPFVHVHRYKAADRSPNHPTYVAGTLVNSARREAAIRVLESLGGVVRPERIAQMMQDIMMLGASASKIDSTNGAAVPGGFVHTTHLPYRCPSVSSHANTFVSSVHDYSAECESMVSTAPWMDSSMTDPSTASRISDDDSMSIHSCISSTAPNVHPFHNSPPLTHSKAHSVMMSPVAQLQPVRDRYMPSQRLIAQRSSGSSSPDEQDAADRNHVAMEALPCPVKAMSNTVV